MAVISRMWHRLASPLFYQHFCDVVPLPVKLFLIVINRLPSRSFSVFVLNRSTHACFGFFIVGRQQPKC